MARLSVCVSVLNHISIDGETKGGRGNSLFPVSLQSSASLACQAGCSRHVGHNGGLCASSSGYQTFSQRGVVVGLQFKDEESLKQRGRGKGSLQSNVDAWQPTWKPLSHCSFHHSSIAPSLTGRICLLRWGDLSVLTDPHRARHTSVWDHFLNIYQPSPHLPSSPFFHSCQFNLLFCRVYFQVSATWR